MSSTDVPLPITMRALYAEAQGQPLTVKTVPTPQPDPGSLIVKVLAVSIEPSIQELLDGKMPYLYTPTPFIPGGRAVGRVAAIGPDTTTLSIGQLVTIEPFVRERDNSLWKFYGVLVYLDKILKRKSSSRFGVMAPYGGFRGIDLKAGETVIVAPATWSFSSAAVELASAMGARVIAVSRNLSKFEKLAAANQRVEIVKTTGNYEEDLARIEALGPVDAYLDLSPQEANGSSHIRACLMPLMGVPANDIDIPYMMAVMKNLTIWGQYMYEREDVKGLIKLVESGLLKLGKAGGMETVGEFSIEQWDEVIKAAVQNPEPGKMAIMYLQFGITGEYSHLSLACSCFISFAEH
ncbi:hypothetical protein EAF00_007816 [Botryotinia globosa]|nr:hypothetical protein EAF00_007816 [Botryotinia globosa]